jgi:hypothetical protein
LRHPGVYRFNSLTIAIRGLLLALPLPPGTNFPPALGIFLLSAGMVEEDSLFVLLGNFIIYSILTVFILASTIGLGWLI